jgi:uncharacterized protein YndB with AHSA1/START domain
MADYTFVTEWRLEAPIEMVWEAILHSEDWPHWWPGVESVMELEPGDAQGIGNRRRYTWKSRLPYRLTFEMRTTRVEPPVALEGRALGELEGNGRWQLSTDGPVTVVRYNWQVQTTKRWMNWLAPLARPLFRWNHDVVMQQGGKGLARRLDVRLLK